jgi:hypothetical protein
MKVVVLVRILITFNNALLELKNQRVFIWSRSFLNLKLGILPQFLEIYHFNQLIIFFAPIPISFNNQALERGDQTARQKSNQILIFHFNLAPLLHQIHVLVLGPCLYRFILKV